MNIFATPYASLRARLAAEVGTAPWPSPEAGFLDFLQGTSGDCPDRPLVTERLEETPMLAAAGYQYARDHCTHDTAYDELWAHHFRRLANKQAFPIDRESYFYRPLDLLGICIGARACPALKDADRRWLRDTLKQGRTKLTEGSRAHILGGIAAAQLGVPWTVARPHTKDLALPALCVLYWIAGQEALAKAVGLDVSRQELASGIIVRTLTATDNYDDLADAGLILYATQEVIERALQSRIDETWHAPVNNRDATRLVRHVCDRFPIVANALKERYHQRPTITMTDEYDVQDLLGALLKLHFEDVRPEEWTPSYAGNSSRVDFILKQEQIAVEAKMTRKGLDQKEVGNQLAVDILRYQAHQDCKTLVCFVYDPTGKCHNPAALENDLTKKHSNLDVVVIVRPKHQ